MLVVGAEEQVEYEGTHAQRTKQVTPLSIASTAAREGNAALANVIRKTR